MDEVEIETETIKLGQFLKLANLVEQGSDARILLSGGEVLVNGEPETRRGRALVRGDVIACHGTTVRVG